MIRAAGDHIEVEGAMTLTSATALLNEGNALVAGGLNVIDLAAVTDIDSSALSVVFGWLRAARIAGKSISIIHPPKDFISLAEVYGVTEYLPLA